MHCIGQKTIASHSNLELIPIKKYFTFTVCKRRIKWVAYEWRNKQTMHQWMNRTGSFLNGPALLLTATAVSSIHWHSCNLQAMTNQLVNFDFHLLWSKYQLNIVTCKTPNWALYCSFVDRHLRVILMSFILLKKLILTRTTVLVLYTLLQLNDFGFHLSHPVKSL